MVLDFSLNRRKRHPMEYIQPGWSIDRLKPNTETGIATVMILMALTFVGLISFFLVLDSTTELVTSDNFESHIRARYAALAGLNHARILVRGLCTDDLLRGPDGAYDSGATFMVQARAFSFRNPLSWTLARSIDILNPESLLGGLRDDGVINTGRSGTMNGVALIPLAGIALTDPDFSGTGASVHSRYFAKVCDNNGEASEIAADPADDPFSDGDGILIIRSMGVARTIAEIKDGSISTNAVSVYEIRLKRLSVFNLDGALVIQGSNILPSSGSMFGGIGFGIEGDDTKPGIATIDIDITDPFVPVDVIRGYLSGSQGNNIIGGAAKPSIQDITPAVGSHPEKVLLLNKDWLWDFVRLSLRTVADNTLVGDQVWTEGDHPDLGSYDPAQSPGLPSQRPRVTFVEGSVSADGAIAGGGLLVISGKLQIGSGFQFNGIVLLIGAGELEIVGAASAINGGVYLAGLSNASGTKSWQTPRFSIGGTSRLRFNQQAVDMGVRLMPPLQQGFREIVSTLDP